MWGIDCRAQIFLQRKQAKRSTYASFHKNISPQIHINKSPVGSGKGGAKLRPIPGYLGKRKPPEMYGGFFNLKRDFQNDSGYSTNPKVKRALPEAILTNCFPSLR